jgi:hypothetical protein
MLNNKEHVSEYESYLKTALKSAFDYSTWHEHQYGVKPDLTVEANLKINVIESTKTAK